MAFGFRLPIGAVLKPVEKMTDRLVGDAGSRATSSVIERLTPTLPEIAGAFELREGLREKREANRDARIAARRVIEFGAERARAIRRAGRRLAGQQSAGFGAAGVLQSGTPSFVIEETLLESILEQELVLNDAAVEATIIRRQARAANRAADFAIGSRVVERGAQAALLAVGLV